MSTHIWWDLPWTVFDTETTGCEPGQDRIVQLAMVIMRHGQVIQQFSQRVNPGIPIPEEASQIHGIYDAHVADKPTLLDLAPRFLPRFAEAEVLVAYNAPFDVTMLKAELGEAWTSALDNFLPPRIIDPLVLIRTPDVGKYWSGPGRHKLTSVARRLGLTIQKNQAHNARGDCLLAGQVLWALRDRVPYRDVDDVAAWIRSEHAGQRLEFEQWLARQPPR